MTKPTLYRKRIKSEKYVIRLAVRFSCSYWYIKFDGFTLDVALPYFPFFAFLMKQKSEEKEMDVAKRQS